MRVKRTAEVGGEGEGGGREGRGSLADGEDVKWLRSSREDELRERKFKFRKNVTCSKVCHRRAFPFHFLCKRTFTFK